MRTVWGYDVSGTIEPLISEGTFHSITNFAYANNPRVEAALKAASQTVRNYCGWHISPSMTCTATPAGGSTVLNLPAAYVSKINSIKENNVTITDYKLRKDGLVKRGHPWCGEWGAIEVSYDAGYEEDAVPDLVEAVCAITSGVLSVSAGVISESADGVSISYSASASSIAAALTSQQKSALEPYKVVNSHAA